MSDTTPDIVIHEEINLNDLNLVASPEEVGQWMADSAIRVWFQYSDDGEFVAEQDGEGVYHLEDKGEEKSIAFTAREFLAKHVELVWLLRVENYRHDMLDFATKAAHADPDEYDDNTVDCVLQNMLYGEVVYG